MYSLVNLLTERIDGKTDATCCGGGGDSALGDSVWSTDEMSESTSRHRGYSADDDDDVIHDVISEFQVADVTHSPHSQCPHQLGNIT